MHHARAVTRIVKYQIKLPTLEEWNIGAKTKKNKQRTAEETSWDPQMTLPRARAVFTSYLDYKFLSSVQIGQLLLLPSLIPFGHTKQQS